MKIPGRFRIPLALAAISVSLSLVLAASLQSGSTYRYLRVFEDVWTYTRSHYVEPVNENALLDGAFRGMVGSLDGASAYLPPGEEKILQAPPAPGRPGMETLPAGGGPMIVRVDPGGPAERAGLAVGDQVWKIGGKSARDVAGAWPQAKRRLSGPVGSQLELMVLDGKTFKMREVKVALEAPRGPGYLLERRGGVLYLRFYDPEFLDLARLQQELSQRLAQDRQVPLLVDLRGTVGLDRAAMGRLAAVFFPGRTAYKLVARQGSDEVIDAAAGTAPTIGRPLFTLVDTTTAGAGEALAALLKERAGALLCGRTTYGLGALPEILPLSRGGSVLLTTREIRTPGGLRWSDKGIEPEKILAPQPRGTIDRDRDILLDEALRFVAEKTAPAKVAPAA